MGNPEDMETAECTGPLFDMSKNDLRIESTEKEDILVITKVLPAVGSDMLVYDNDTEMEETVPCLQKKVRRDAQIAQLLLIADRRKKEADKTKEQMKEMESWKSEIESKLEALTGALTGIAEQLSATAKAQSAVELMVKSQGESITTALATMQTQMAQLAAARQ